MGILYIPLSRNFYNLQNSPSHGNPESLPGVFFGSFDCTTYDGARKGFHQDSFYLGWSGKGLQLVRSILCDGRMSVA
jgi:hypothetical protein